MWSIDQSIAGKSLSPSVRTNCHCGGDNGHESTVKIAQAGFPIVYAIIGGNPCYFKKVDSKLIEIGGEAAHEKRQMTTNGIESR